MESAFRGMWDVPSSVIFCSSCILMFPGICCTYFPNPFLISTMTPITTGIVVAFIPHILSPLISRSLCYFIWSVLSSGDGHINEQAACFVFVLDYNVWSLAFLSISVCIGICHKIVMLSCYCFGLMLRPFLVYVYIHLFADVPVKVWAWRLCCVCVGIQFWPATAPCHNMVNSFLKLTEIVVGLDGLILGSNNKAMPSCLQPLVGHLMVRIFFLYSFWYCPRIGLSSNFCFNWSWAWHPAFCLTFLA